MKPLTKPQKRRLARVWAGKMLEQQDTFGRPNPNVISNDDLEDIAELVHELGEKLMGDDNTCLATLEAIALDLFPTRK